MPWHVAPAGLLLGDADLLTVHSPATFSPKTGREQDAGPASEEASGLCGSGFLLPARVGILETSSNRGMQPMERILTQVVWLIPAQNMHAVGLDGTTIAPAPSARTGPVENVIMNVTDAERFLYHYCSLDTAKKIVSGQSLRMGEFQRTNDPKESKEWHFDLLSRSHTDFRGFDSGKLSTELSDAIKKHTRVLCFCRDSGGLTGDHLADVSLRGHFKARMWAQYAKDHTGVCLILDRKRLLERFQKDCGDAWLLASGEITYRNRSVAPRREEKDYFIDCDVLKTVGFDRYWMLHARQFHRRLFFEKSLDWRDECEFRMLSVLRKPREVFVDIQDSLSGFFLGERCDVGDAKDLIEILMDRGVHVMGLSWRNCTPWYDFGNQTYNFSARALQQEIRRRESQPEQQLPE